MTFFLLGWQMPTKALSSTGLSVERPRRNLRGMLGQNQPCQPACNTPNKPNNKTCDSQNPALAQGGRSWHQVPCRELHPLTSWNSPDSPGKWVSHRYGSQNSKRVRLGGKLEEPEAVRQAAFSLFLPSLSPPCLTAGFRRYTSNPPPPPCSQCPSSTAQLDHT